MFSRRLKNGYFILEGMNSFATVFYFYYLYFYLHLRFGFGNQANLAVAALSGGSYALFAWGAGKFAQRFGYFTALKLGFSVMIMALTTGLVMKTAAGEIAVMIFTVFGMSFTWPTLEALVSEEEPREGLQHMVGIYNVVWAATAAVSNFSGGAMLEKLGPPSLFYVPVAVLLIQLGLTFWLERQARPVVRRASSPAEEPAVFRSASGEASSVAGRPPDPLYNQTNGSRPPAKAFLRMAWLANPFAYVAINTLIGAMPSVAGRLHLSTMLAGFCASVWCFARLGAFVGLWCWDGWHYRFRWLVTAYVALIVAFALVLLVPNLAVLVSAQIIFGGAVGLIYYSSLFYSMDVGETKGEHGGIHEAVIGLGNCAGPAVGAAALYVVPQYANSGALAVTGLLVAGLGGLVAIWRLARQRI